MPAYYKYDKTYRNKWSTYSYYTYINNYSMSSPLFYTIYAYEYYNNYYYSIKFTRISNYESFVSFDGYSPIYYYQYTSPRVIRNTSSKNLRIGSNGYYSYSYYTYGSSANSKAYRVNLDVSTKYSFYISQDYSTYSDAYSKYYIGRYYDSDGDWTDMAKQIFLGCKTSKAFTLTAYVNYYVNYNSYFYVYAVSSNIRTIGVSIFDWYAQYVYYKYTISAYYAYYTYQLSPGYDVYQPSIEYTSVYYYYTYV